MCVIVASETGAVPPSDDLAKMQEANNDGIGIAWLHKGKVIFRRHILLSTAMALLSRIENKRVPYILHFRFATSGGRHPYLCHPFPVTTNQQEMFRLNGETSYALAHNGGWSEWWKDVSVPAAEVRTAYSWSDSAAIAYIAAIRREIVIPAGSRIATLHALQGLQLFGTGWSEVTLPERGKYSLSNEGWRNRFHVSFGGGLYFYRQRLRSGSGSGGVTKPNMRPCMHGRYVFCEICPETSNHRPIEMPDKADLALCTYTDIDNGLLATVGGHGCQHPGAGATGGKGGHFHCQFCSRSECKQAYEKLTLVQQEPRRNVKPCDLPVHNALCACNGCLQEAILRGHCGLLP